jgi:general secretion pathway protein G
MEVVKMIKSRHLRGTVAAWFLVLLSFSAGVQAEISPRSTGDELLQIVPAESLFCMRVNNFDSTLSTIDQFLADIFRRPPELSRTVRQKLSGMLNSPELNGVNMEGNFAVFGVSKPDIADILVGVLIPVTDYKQFLDGITNISPPNENRISKIRSGGHAVLIKQVGNYALCLQGEYEKLTAIAISISEGKMAGLDSVLDAAEVQQAIEEPLWAYGNVQQAGPFLSNQLEQMRTMMENMESHTQANIEKLEQTRNEMANMISNRKTEIEKIEQQHEKLREQYSQLQAKMEQMKIRLADMDPNGKVAIDKLKQRIDERKKLSSALEEQIEKIQQMRNQLADMDPNKSVAIRILDQQIEKLKKQKKLPSDRQAPEAFKNVMNMYAAFLEKLMKETKSLSLTVRPRPNVCNLTVNVSAVPGTEMANMFVADTSIVKENRLLGYLKDGAMMNFAGKMNTPFWKKLKLKSVDFLSAIAGESMTAEDITKAKTLASDGISALGGAVAFSFFIDANSKPPFAFKYVLEVKDVDKFNNVLEEASEMMNVGGIADFYKSLGIEMGFTIKRGVGSYKGVSIDTAKLVMKSTDPNLPQGQMINAMYGDGFEYRWAIVDGLCVFTVGGDVDSAILKLIDEVKEGGSEQMAAEMKAALTLLPEAGRADFMGTYNFLRLFRMMGAMAGAFMPAPAPMAQMDITTKSNIVFAGKAGNNRMTVDIALPKEHLIEIVAAFQPPLDKASSLSKVIESARNLSTIGKALLIYANDHEHQYPPNLQVLVEKGYIKRPEILESPRKPKDFDGPGYIYIAGQSTRTSEPGNIIVYENPEFCSDKINVLFIDTHVEAMKPAEFLERLQETYKRLGREMPEIKFKSPTRPTVPQKMPQPTMRPQKAQEARVIITKANLRILHTAIMQFKMDTGRFPTEEEGLRALIEQPADVTNYPQGGYLDTTKIPKDGWGNDLIYERYPESGRPFVIKSLGADGEEGGEGCDADLFSTNP